MDPHFIPLLLSQFAEHAQILENAQIEANEERRNQKHLEYRKNLFESARAESSILIQESFLNPQETFVKCRLLCNRLEHWKIIPDSLEDKIEKDDIVSLWKKLTGISEKCQKQMTSKELDQCIQCLDAIEEQKFIWVVSQRLAEYQKFEKIKADLEKQKSFQKMLRLVCYAIVVIGMIAFALFLDSTNSFKTVSDFLIFVAIIAGPLILFVFLWFRSKLLVLDKKYQKYHQGIEDQKYWTVVRQKFNGMPTEDVLKRAWSEQEAVVRVVFKSTPT